MILTQNEIKKLPPHIQKKLGARPRKNKYRNNKQITEEGKFDSKLELARWDELKKMEKAGEISDLRRQVPYELVPAYRENGKVIERQVNYVADFVYKDFYGETVVEDAKGLKTKEYIIKRKLMLHIHGIKIQEVYK